MKTLIYVTSIFIANLGIFNWFDDAIFSGNIETYPDELYNFMSSIPESEEDALMVFLNAWERDSLFTEEEQNDIIEISQLLVKKKVKPSPYFVNYLDAYMKIKQYEISTQNYNNWVDGVKNTLKKKRINTTLINHLFTRTSKIVEQQVLFQSNSVTWKSKSPNYIFDTENKELVVRFSSLDLVCYAKNDSLAVYNTTGYYNLLTNTWYGEKARVTWERAGYQQGDVFADIGGYSIDMNRPEFYADGTIFTNKFYFDKPLEGTLHFKVSPIRNPESATYPKFDSYTKTFDIKGLYKDIHFVGGLAMHGAKLVGTGSSENPAVLYMYRRDTLRLVARSLYIGFLTDKISSERTEVSIKLKSDSIYHPDLALNYQVGNRELTLIKNNNFSSQSPYFNSYHAVDMNFDQLTWRMDEDLMYLQPTKGSVTGRAYFESKDFFNYNTFLDLMGMDYQHPLSILSAFARSYRSTTFTIKALAAYLNMPETTVEHRMMRLAKDGFIFYDYNTRTITIKEKLYDYLDASRNLIDYDVIGFPSRVDAPLENGVFNLQNYDLKINGIPYVHLSDSQNVGIYPNNNTITLKRGRNFQFDGRVDAGLLTFEGENFFFNYDSFKINLQNVESIKVRYQTGNYDGRGMPIVEEVTSLVQNVTGEILIDRDNNKSGRESLPEYPIFTSRENSYVYYESGGIENGVYSSEDFFFQMEPFVMDSLDNFNYKGLEYKGTFFSAGIFPVFDKELSIQPDKSLGFSHKTPQNGWPVYGGKAQYYNEFTLNNSGLRGNGKLEYITSTTWSGEFVFHPDSLMALANKFNIKKNPVKTEYPYTTSSDNSVLFQPYADVMYIDRNSENFTMFNDSITLNGKLTLRPKGLTGRGTMDLKNSILKSDLISYKANELFSDTADFSLQSVNGKDYTVLTNNINTHIDFSRRKGWFKANEEFTLVSFPENKYVSYLDVFEWDMDKKTLAMGVEPQYADTSNEDVEPYGARYVSIHHQQDSLNFVSPYAMYDYRNNIIDARYVKFIDVADARIYPNKGLVKVNENADMQRLNKSRVKANRLTQFHNIHTSSVKITSRNNYYGNGKYNYVDENDDIQVITFDNIEVDKGITIAQGYIADSVEFTLSPVYGYKGKVNLTANRQFLTFTGGVMLSHFCNKLPTDWFYFTSEINPKDIFIPVPDQAENYEQQRIYNGMFMYYDSVHVYPAFMSSRKYHSDNPFVQAKGFLYYNKADKMYKIGSKEKINDFTLAEPYISLHRENCILYSEGPLSLGSSLGQLKSDIHGYVRHTVGENKTELDVLMGLDFFLNDAMLTYIGGKIDSLTGFTPVDLNRAALVKNMKSMLGEKNYQAMMDELNLFGSVKKLPEKMNQSIIFNELKLIWDDDANSYQSVGKIGLASINGVLINKRVDGFMELSIKRSGNIFDIYLDFGGGKYLYFGYTRGVMQTLSDDDLYNKTILDMKTKERKMKVPRNQDSYVFLIATERKKQRFYGRWKDVEENRKLVE